MGLGTLVKGSLQILAIVVLARLLDPDDFGVMAMIFPIIAFATIFQEAGLGLAVLQRKTISDEELSTMFWINAGMGAILALALVATAPLAAAFYQEPRVAALTAAFGALIFPAALSTQQLALLNRHLRFRALALVDGEDRWRWALGWRYSLLCLRKPLGHFPA
jgi:PST family polysaccharide transporter